MGLLDSAGKRASAGQFVVYHLEGTQMIYCEPMYVKENDDSFILQGDHAVLLTVQQQGNKANISMQKVSTAGLKSLVVRLMKSAVTMVTDVGDPELVKKVSEVLSGLVLPGGAEN